MMYNYYNSFFKQPHYHNIHHKPINDNYGTYNANNKDCKTNSSQSFPLEILGLKLPNDDIIILLLILFLYLENSKDTILYIILLSLLFE